MKKGTKIYSIFTGKCPRCHKESMYKFSNPYSLLHILDMHKSCTNCKLTYQIEPSFFYGSMYVSYGVGIVFSLVTFAVAKGLLDFGMMGCFLSIVGVLLLGFPVIARLSRNIWINGFINYDKKYAK